MNVLVTGGMGYIGSHTCVELMNCGHEVVIVDNLRNSSATVLPRLQQLTGRMPTFYELDVREEVALGEVFDRHAIDCVIHFAAQKVVGESVTQPLQYYEHNLICLLTVCRIMMAHGVKRMIFSSSATVYSHDSSMPLHEQAPIGNCANPYGWTKYFGEQILRDLANAEAGFSAVLLRYFNPIGAHPSGLIGEEPGGTPNNLMPLVLQTACGQRAELAVFGNDYGTPDGTCIRDYIHVMDLARGHVQAIDYLMQHIGVEVFNLGTGRGTSVLELLDTFEQVTGQTVPRRMAARRQGDLPVCYAAVDKSARLMNWRAQYSLQDMCRDSWHYQCQRLKEEQP